MSAAALRASVSMLDQFLSPAKSSNPSRPQSCAPLKTGTATPESTPLAASSSGTGIPGTEAAKETISLRNSVSCHCSMGTAGAGPGTEKACLEHHSHSISDPGAPGVLRTMQALPDSDARPSFSSTGSISDSQFPDLRNLSAAKLTASRIFPRLSRAFLDASWAVMSRPMPASPEDLPYWSRRTEKDQETSRLPDWACSSLTPSKLPPVESSSSM